MTWRMARCAFGICFLALLGACGGGAGPLVIRPLAQQQEARPTFNVQAAFNNSITDVAPLAFKVEGLANGVPFTGSGTYEQSMLETVSEFGNLGGALRKRTPVRMRLDVKGRQVSVDAVAQDFYARYGLQLLGRIGPAPNPEFIEVTRYDGLPSQAQVGASGTLYTAERYTDASKRTALGHTQADFTVEPDNSGDSALLVVRTVDSDLKGATASVTVTTYRIAQGGTATRVSEATRDASGNTTLKASFI